AFYSCESAPEKREEKYITKSVILSDGTNEFSLPLPIDKQDTLRVVFEGDSVRTKLDGESEKVLRKIEENTYQLEEGNGGLVHTQFVGSPDDETTDLITVITTENGTLTMKCHKVN